jgi:hypothetical protein
MILLSSDAVVDIERVRSFLEASKRRVGKGA